MCMYMIQITALSKLILAGNVLHNMNSDISIKYNDIFNTFGLKLRSSLIWHPLRKKCNLFNFPFFRI